MFDMSCQVIFAGRLIAMVAMVAEKNVTQSKR